MTTLHSAAAAASALQSAHHSRTASQASNAAVDKFVPVQYVQSVVAAYNADIDGESVLSRPALYVASADAIKLAYEKLEAEVQHSTQLQLTRMLIRHVSNDCHTILHRRTDVAPHYIDVFVRVVGPIIQRTVLLAPHYEWATAPLVVDEFIHEWTATLLTLLTFVTDTNNAVANIVTSIRSALFQNAFYSWTTNNRKLVINRMPQQTSTHMQPHHEQARQVLPVIRKSKPSIIRSPLNKEFISDAAAAANIAHNLTPTALDDGVLVGANDDIGDDDVDVMNDMSNVTVSDESENSAMEEDDEFASDTNISPGTRRVHRSRMIGISDGESESGLSEDNQSRTEENSEFDDEHSDINNAHTPTRWAIRHELFNHTHQNLPENNLRTPQRCPCDWRDDLIDEFGQQNGFDILMNIINNKDTQRITLSAVNAILTFFDFAVHSFLRSEQSAQLITILKPLVMNYMTTLTDTQLKA